MMHALVLLSASIASISDRDANAALMYIQSVVTPAVFEVCKSLDPQRAATYDEDLERWAKKNKRIVARGERVMRDQARRDGSDIEARSRAEAEAMVSELKALSVPEQRERCESLMNVVRSES